MLPGLHEKGGPAKLAVYLLLNMCIFRVFEQLQVSSLSCANLFSYDCDCRKSLHVLPGLLQEFTVIVHSL